MENKSTKELKVIAKELGVKGWWELKKVDLIKAIEEAQAKTSEEQQAEAEQKAREYAAMKAYDKDWRKYTKRYNPVEFIEKFRAGEITIEEETVEKVKEKPKRKNRKKADLTEKEVKYAKHDQESIEEIVGQDSLEDQEKDSKKVEKKPRGRQGNLIEFEGRSMNLNAWAKELGISSRTLFGRINNLGWSIEKAFTTPGRKKD